MFYRISNRIADRFTEKKVIPPEEKELYRFGVQQGLSIALNVVTTFVIGLVFRMVLESFLFLAVYIPLRSFAGGIHAKTANRCYVYSSFMIIAVLLVIKFFPLGNLICSCLSFLSGIIIFLLAPVEAEHKKLDEIEYVVYRKRSRIILVAEIIIQLLLSMIMPKRFIMCFSLSFVCLATVMIVGAVKNKGSFANVGVVKSICKQVQTAAYQGSNHGISATGGFTSHGYSCRNRVSFVN